MTGGHGAHLGFGCDGRPLFWIGTGKPALGGCHVAFAAPDWVAADVFYKAALTAGGRDNGGLDDISDAELAAVPSPMPMARMTTGCSRRSRRGIFSARPRIPLRLS